MKLSAAELALFERLVEGIAPAALEGEPGSLISPLSFAELCAARAAALGIATDD